MSFKQQIIAFLVFSCFTSVCYSDTKSCFDILSYTQNIAEEKFNYDLDQAKLVNVKPDPVELEEYSTNPVLDGSKKVPPGLELEVPAGGLDRPFYTGSISAQSDYIQNFFKMIQEKSNIDENGVSEREYAGAIVFFDDDRFSSIDFTSDLHGAVTLKVFADALIDKFTNSELKSITKIIHVHTHPVIGDLNDPNRDLRRTHIVPSGNDYSSMKHIETFLTINGLTIEIEVIGIILPTSPLNMDLYIEYYGMDIGDYETKK